MLQQTTVKAVAPYFARFLARWPDVDGAGRGAARRRAASYGPGSATTRAPATCTPARRRWSSGTAEISAHRGGAARRCPGIGALHRSGDRGDCVRRAARCRSTAMSSGWWRGCSRSRTNCRRRKTRSAAGAGVGAGRARRRFRAGDDGSRRDDLHAGEAGLRALPMDGCCAARAARRSRRRFRARRRSGKAGCGAAPPSWLVRADGCVLVRRAPPKGLLGGMTEVPTTEWSHDFDETNALKGAPGLSRAKPKWRRVPGVVRHVFTHFPLELAVYVATVPASATAPGDMRWIRLPSFRAKHCRTSCARSWRMRSAMTIRASSDHFALIPAALITFAHFSPSARMSRAKSSGLPPTASRPS